MLPLRIFVIISRCKTNFMKGHFFTVLFLMAALVAKGQIEDKLFGPAELPPARKGFILNANGDYDMPGGDMAKRFGESYRLGPALMYKTKSNFIFGAKFDFIFGNTIREDSLFIDIRDRYSTKSTHLYEFINGNGERIGVPIYERGYAVGLTFGKIFSFSKHHPDDGLMIMATGGFVQHKINIYDKDKTVQQLSGDYKKGYDRLTNGAFIEGYAGYTHFSKTVLINYTIGIDAMIGFTQGRRDYLYDVMHGDTKKRTDILFGLRAGWFIPMFKRKSEDLLFE